MKIEYRAEIDGLRAIAVLSVIFFHAKFIIGEHTFFTGGYVGVDVFFVISGYLITSIILKEMKAGTFRFSQFYERRARRILPALFTVLITTIPFALLLLIPWQLIDFAKSTLATLLFISNIFFWNQSGYFSPDLAGMPLLHTWSLAIEEQFYILFPLFLFFIWRSSPKLLLPLLGATIIISLFLAARVTPVQPESSFFLLPTRLWELMCGAVLAKLESDFGRAKHGFFITTMPIFGLGLIMYSVWFFNDKTLHPGYYTLIPVFGSMLLIWFGNPGELVTDLLSKSYVVFIGLISYSFYLWHYPFFAFSSALGLVLNNFQSTSMILLSLFLSIISYHYIEKPFRRTAIPLKILVSFSMISTVILLICACVALMGDGGMGRYQQSDLEIVKTSPIQHGKYVNARFAELMNRPFEDIDKTRILVIGDSYAQDLVNAIYESDLDQKYQLSTFLVSISCWNEFTLRSYADKKDSNEIVFCNKDSGIIDRLQHANVIWLALSWRQQQAEQLPASLEHISVLSRAKILVLGRKDFGSFNTYNLIKIPIEERLNTRMDVSNSHWETNELMKNTLTPDVFINLQELLCDGLRSCPIFDNDLNLISYDGNHLTKAGARLLGSKFKNNKAFLDAISNK